MRPPLLVQEKTITQFPRAFLQRQAISFRTRRGAACLGWERTGRRNPGDVRPAFHGLGEEVRTEPPGQGGGDGLGKEQPDMSSVARSRSFPGQPAGSVRGMFADGFGVFPPMGLVKVGCQEEAGFILEHGIDAHDEIAALVVLARQVPANHVIRNRQEAAVLDTRHT